MFRHALSVLAVPVLGLALGAQCPLVQDINTIVTPFDGNPSTARVGEGGTFADGMLRCGAYWYFVATSAGTGAELWKTDGTAAGTVLVKDIAAGTASSDPFWLTCCNGKVFFQAKTAAQGTELWVSDGTAAGTVLVKDIQVGTGSSNPTNLCCLGKQVLFTASDGTTGFELWISDGTAVGTKLLMDIRSGPLSGAPQYLEKNFIGNKVYFQADDGINGVELWSTDGTILGTMLLKDIRAGAASSLPSCFIDNPSHPLQTLFTADEGATGRRVWRTEGTGTGTGWSKCRRPGTRGSDLYMYYSRQSALGGSIYFGADDGVHGNELWKTNGTAAGTVLVQDIDQGLAHGDPTRFRTSGSRLYFQACTVKEGCELYMLSGTTVTLVRDIQRGIGNGDPSHITALANGSVVFAADDGVTQNGEELWISDGTKSGTRLLQDIWSGAASSEPAFFTPLPTTTKILFFASNGANGSSGRELFETDGTAAGTRLFKDLYPGGRSNSSAPGFLTGSQGSVLYFAADDGVSGRELYKTDAQGTVLLMDIHPGPGSSAPYGFVDVWSGGRVLTVFRADDGKNGSELWVTDGTTAGTHMLVDIDRGAGSSKPNSLVRYQDRVVFSASNATTGYELWITDGTASGTYMLKDIEPGSGSSVPNQFTEVGNTLYFVAFARSSTGLELWKTDGTAAGTMLVKDIWPGTVGSSPRELTPFGKLLLFQANDGPNGVELWRSDGTAQGTYLVNDLAPGSVGAHPTNLTLYQGAVYFSATLGGTGTELWKTDGTAAGTVLVKDIEPGTGSSRPGPLTVSQGRLWFSASTAATGTELFVSDGTSTGTRLVKDIRTGIWSSSPIYLVAAGDGVFFSADDGTRGKELFFSDGSATGTTRFCDINPGSADSYPSALTASGGRLYFTADDGLHGFELFRIGGNPAVVERLGPACGSARPTLHATQPLLGKNCNLSGEGPATGVRLLILGARSQPYAIPALLAPDCAMWESLQLSWVLPLPAGASWNLPLPIPQQASLTGVQVALQSVQGLLPLSLSNGLQITPGR